MHAHQGVQAVRHVYQINVQLSFVVGAFVGNVVRVVVAGAKALSRVAVVRTLVVVLKLKRVSC